MTEENKTFHRGVAMVGGNPAHGRHQNDFYRTPPDVLVPLVFHYLTLFRAAMSVWEPSAGDGALVPLLRAMCPNAMVMASDKYPSADWIAELDALEYVGSHPNFVCDIIVTNPPFSLAHKFIEALVPRAKTTMFLLPAHYWNAASRYKLFHIYRPCAVHPLTWRPDFAGKGRPVLPVMWCVWNDDMLSNNNNCTVFSPLNKHYRSCDAILRDLASEEQNNTPVL